MKKPIPKFDKNNNLRIGMKIIGYVRQSRKTGGYAYLIGKPSDISVASFTSNKEPFTEEQAKQRLINAVTPLPF